MTCIAMLFGKSDTNGVLRTVQVDEGATFGCGFFDVLHGISLYVRGRENVTFALMSKHIKVTVLKTVYADMYFTVSDEFDANKITGSALRRAAKEQCAYSEDWKTDPESFEIGDITSATLQEVKDYDLDDIKDEDRQLLAIG